MVNVKLTIEYQGKNFAGWQVQPNQATVQGEIVKAIKQITQEEVRLIASGRTDSGVHAKGQIANFNLKKDPNFYKLPKSLNAVLPEGIAILLAERVPEGFHSQYDAVSKKYQYLLLNRSAPPTIKKGLVWHYPQHLNEKLINDQLQMLVGRYDFSAFRAADCGNKNPVKELIQAQVLRRQDLIIFELVGSGFLKHMVRNIVGTAVMYGLEDKAPKQTLQDILISKDRSQAGKTAPAEGLYLKEVNY